MGIVQATLIVVPCYNEAGRLDLPAFDNSLRRDHNLRYVFVDDGSTDRTAALVGELAASWKERVHLLQLARNSGKAEAVRCGVLHGATLGPELIGYWDADLATPLATIAEFAAAFEDPSVWLVLGARVQLLGRTIQRSPVRHCLGRVFATFVSWQLKLPVYDTQCGAKLFRASPEVMDLFSRPFALRWCFDVELLSRFASLFAGLHDTQRCIEHPVSRWTDVSGSKLTFGQVVGIASELCRLPGVVRREQRLRPTARQALTR